MNIIKNKKYDVTNQKLYVYFYFILIVILDYWKLYRYFSTAELDL